MRSWLGVAAAVGLVWLCGLAVQRPVMARSDAPRAGAQVFADSGCAHCHGADGKGTDKGPALRDLRKRLRPERITDQIENGGKEMPPFHDVLTPEQVESLVAFLRAKQWVAVPASVSGP